MTLNNTANTVVQGNATPGTDAQTVTFGSGAAAQSVTINSTGAVTFNVTAAALATVSAADVDATQSAAEDLQSFIAVAGATAVVNVTGAGGAFGLLDATPAEGDDDLAFTNIDTVNINTTTASTIVAAAQDAEIDFTLNLGTVAGHNVAMDTNGTQDGVVTVTGFAAGASGDIVTLSEATTADLPGDDITAVASVATTGYTVTSDTVAAADIAEVVILTSATAQITGPLTGTGDAGGVEAAILAAGMNAVTGDATTIYVVADNGTATGIYRVAVDTAAADGAAGGAIDAASEICRYSYRHS